MELNSLYTPSLEGDACGIGFVAHLKGQASHQLVRDALRMLQRLEHRGARGADADTGDGAGILIQLPHDFFQQQCEFPLPQAGSYAVGSLFFPSELPQQNICREMLNKQARRWGLQLLGSRQVPVRSEQIGKTARKVEPLMEHHFFAPAQPMEQAALERKLYVFRRAVEQELEEKYQIGPSQFYFSSLSTRTLIYKGQLTTDQVASYFPDLDDPSLKSALALVHSRFSTNTFPSWRLAQPFSYLAHNGEINTLRGNLNMGRSREAILRSQLFTEEELQTIIPVVDEKASDSANLNRMVELLLLCGRSLPEVLMLLIPEAWETDAAMSEEKRAFYEYHSAFMEPWDGPASICFTDGVMVGATLDRNGLRPSRYLLTRDDQLIMSSEAGALPVDPKEVVLRGRLEPGKMFVADLQAGRIISDEEVKEKICKRHPYRQWLDTYQVPLKSLPLKKGLKWASEAELLERQKAFGYTREDLKLILAPMAEKGKEPIGSMGADAPLAVLSQQSQHLANYFRQLFAQVSNPPIDPIREKMVMSLRVLLGKMPNLLDPQPIDCQQIELKQPVLTPEDFSRLKQNTLPAFPAREISLHFSLEESLEDALDRIEKEAEEEVRNGASLLILSDRQVGPKHLTVPSLLAGGAVHQHLLRQGLRAQASLIVDAGDVIEVQHFACLLSFGVEAIFPRLVYETLAYLPDSPFLRQQKELDRLSANYLKAVKLGLLKILSKLGISTLQSYRGAQTFEILGIRQEVVDRCFRGAISRIGGLGLEELEKELRIRHQAAFPESQASRENLAEGGFFQWKLNGEDHLFNPETVHLLQHASRRNDYATYKKYANKINAQEERAFTLRGLMRFAKQRPSIPLEKVEPVENIFKRFSTGAMSFGSISWEAHTTLAIAMNRIGGKSNSGEGGEDPRRYQVLPNGDSMRSAIKQVASGRFGVNSHYLSQADELQIKIAQGAKPGEGGHLPGHKVDEWIGRVRNAVPGVGLISPPPHHDIYSIEDLAQLIFDLKNANPKARISVKLVSKAGVGTIAAGVAKAHADVILISGAGGGTGASPMSSIRHAGLPWELGLAEAHQTLVKNNLRSRVVLQTDGQIKTGRDLAVAALLGAEEFSVATAALVVEGCIMMRKCHLNTCPVGVATQNPELRKHFPGKPEQVVNFFRFLAEDLREIMAEMGFRTVNEMIGQTDQLTFQPLDHWKTRTLDLSPILFREAPSNKGLYKQEEQNHGLEEVLDQTLLREAQPLLKSEVQELSLFHPIQNTDRAVGTLLSYHLSHQFGAEGLPAPGLKLRFKGSAGQSFAAFGARGLSFELEGEANDYLGKGLSGAQLVLYPHKESTYRAHEQVIAGNVAFYGATAGQAYLNGQAGERFCVRNSGLTAVVEGVGDHGCEYMTGGTVLILGPTGKNFAAGMSGGVAYLLDPDQKPGKSLQHRIGGP
jgi:glutamate synthase (NADPH/NADH) large chain